MASFNTDDMTIQFIQLTFRNLSVFRSCLVIALLLFAIPSAVQAKDLDSLKNTLREAVVGKDMLTLLDMASKHATDDLNLALAYADIALDDAEKTQDDKKMFSIYREKGFFYEDNNQLANALMCYHNALESAIKLDNNEYKLIIYNDLAITHRRLGNYKRTKDYHDKSLELAQKVNDLKMVEFSYHGLGYLYETIGDYDKAIEYYFQSLEVAEIRGSVNGVIVTMQNIALTYIKLSNQELALKTIDKAHVLAVKENDTLQIANVLHDYGEVLREVGRYDQALERLRASKEVYERYNMKPTIARSLINIADIFTMKGEYEIAQRYFMESLNYDQYIGSEDYAILFNKLGNLYLKINKKEKAERAFQNSLEISQKHDFKKLIQANNHSLYSIYSQKGMYKDALQHLVTTSKMKDYLLNEDKTKRIAEMQFRFDAEKSEKEIQLLKLRQNKLMLTGSISIFICIVLFLIYIIKMRGKNNSALQSKNEEIQAQNVKLKESNEVLNQFAYVAAHDLKEPLRNIGSFINLIQIKYGHQFNEEANEYMEFVTTSVRRLNNLLTDLLEYSRISSQEPAKEVISIKKIIQIVLSNLHDSILRKEALVNFPEDMPSIQMSKLHLIQLFQNLISNALKFVDGQPVINISTKQTGELITITIRDNGIGIDPEFGNKIFNLFHQLNKNKKYEGTGIGLTICKNIVDKYDGKIWFESDPGKGTAFFICLPIRQTETAKEQAAMPASAELVPA
ncbi:MAG: tetratricopeptide repeat protein [Bacteroidota bacterium]